MHLDPYMLGGIVVGMTSVGSGSLMIILLLFLYPTLGAKQLVGTDLTQAVPLTFAAALGALVFGHVEFGVTFSLILGSVPAVLVGSMLSSSAPDRYIGPVITFVVFASGLKYVGVATTVLGWDPGRHTGDGLRCLARLQATLAGAARARAAGRRRPARGRVAPRQSSTSARVSLSTDPLSPRARQRSRTRPYQPCPQSPPPALPLGPIPIMMPAPRHRRRV